MTNLISMDKKYKTRDGKFVRVLCVDNDDEEFPVIASIKGVALNFTSTGAFHTIPDYEHPLDLIEQPQEHFVWIELCKRFGSICSYVHSTEEGMHTSIRHGQAQNYACSYTLLATKKISVAEGSFVHDNIYLC